MKKVSKVSLSTSNRHLNVYTKNILTTKTRNRSRCSTTMHLLFVKALSACFCLIVAVAQVTIACQYQHLYTNNNNNDNDNKADASPVKQDFHQENSNVVNKLIACPRQQNQILVPTPMQVHNNAQLERQQQQILKNLNASFANYLQLSFVNQQQQQQPNIELATTTNDNHPAYSLTSQSDAVATLSDELINEIVSPRAVDAAFERAKSTLARRRKFENEMLRQGKILYL